MEDDATRPEPSVESAPAEDPNELAARLKKLEEEAAALRAAMQQRKVDAQDASAPAEDVAPEPIVEAESPPSHEDASELQHATPEQIEKAETLLRQSRLARSRNQNEEAARLLKQAQETAPHAPSVLEAIGDDHAERKQYSKAKEAYKEALKFGQTPALERKYGEMVLRSSGGAYSPNLASEFEVMANARSAALLSIVFPGLGQIVMGQIAKGATILVVWLACLIWFLSDQAKLRGFLGLFGIRSGQGAAQFDAVLLIPLAGIVLMWIISMIDATGRAKASGRSAGRGGSGKPRPPVDLPFD